VKPLDIIYDIANQISVGVRRIADEGIIVRVPRSVQEFLDIAVRR
jgi:hypothetical protein